MKKILVLILTLALLLCGAFFACAVAEAPDAPASGPVIDLTGLVIALLLAAFEFLFTRFARVLIPPAKKWLEAHTTEKERGLLWNAVCELVDAAEQIITGEKMGKEKMAYVQAGLMQRGLSVDTDMIEAAVKRLNERAMYAVGETLDMENLATLDLDDDGEPDLDITHWSLAQLKTFFKLNNFDDTGFTTREEYVDFLSNPPA